MCQALCHVGNVCAMYVCERRSECVYRCVCACVFEDERVAVEYTLPI